MSVSRPVSVWRSFGYAEGSLDGGWWLAELRIESFLGACWRIYIGKADELPRVIQWRDLVFVGLVEGAFVSVVVTTKALFSVPN